MAEIKASTLIRAKEEAQRYLIVGADESVWLFDGTTWTDITGNDALANDGTKTRWSGGWLTGAVVLGNQNSLWAYQVGIDTAIQRAQYDGDSGETWADLGYSARVFRPWREYVLAGNLLEDDVRYPARIRWCHPVQPGQVPTDWVPRDTNRAGDRDLADTPGDVVDMIPLRKYLMIYKQDSVFTCAWIGGNDVFSIERLTMEKGILSRDCVAEYLSRHWVQGVEDIYLLDGNRIDSMLWGRIKKTWLADRDPTRAQNNWTCHDPVNEEMLFGFVSKNAPPEYEFPDRILVASLKNNTWTHREYGVEIPHALVALSIENQASADLVMHGIDRTNARLLDLESVPDRLGAPVPAHFTRSALFSDPGHDFVQVDRAKLQITGANAQLQLGDQIALDAPITWRGSFDIDPETDYKTDARANGNLIAYRIDVNATTPWQISNLNLLVQKSGARG